MYVSFNFVLFGWFLLLLFACLFDLKGERTHKVG